MNLLRLISKLKLVKGNFLLLLLALQLIYSCGPARHLNEGEKLLTKVSIKSVGKKKYREELKSIAKQKPNRRLLGLFKIYLGIYNLYYYKEDSKIKEKLGEAPVIYDSTLAEVSVDLMNRYLKNRGYYDNTVYTKTKETKKKAKTSYFIDKKERYKIKQLRRTIKDKAIEAIFLSDSANTKLKINAPFDVEALKAERIRIERLLKNFGYYKFSREYVVFEVDTFERSKTANLNLVIKNPTVKVSNSDSLVEGRHETYTINKVIVRMDYDAQKVNGLSGDTSLVDSMIFVDLEGAKFNKKAISRITYLRPNNLYSLETQEQTYRNLSALRVFSYVSIQYLPDYTSSENRLDAYIDLNARKQKSLTIETEGTNNGGNLGLNGAINFQNNNTFKGAEILNVSLNGGLEAQRILTSSNDDQVIDGFLPFNTLEFGPEVNLEVPRFLLPINADRFSPRGNPRTTFNASYNLQERPDYRRDVTKTYIAYSWNESATKTHIVQPFDVSYIKLDPSSEFSELLTTIQNPFLRNSYTDNLISAAKYSFILNTKNSNQLKNYFFFRGNIESAGNLMSLFASGLNVKENEDGSYNIADIRFAQYLRSDIDFRYYQNFNFNRLVYRFAGGIGIPYGNSLAMPFEKSFYSGGANGIRAWRTRELGPGNLPDSTERNVDQIGNMSLEANIEFRFPITKFIEGAAFLDAGNIWNYNQEDSRTETQFKASKIWDGTAIGIGSGVRLNFTYFILRLDAATKFKDPSLEKPNKINPQWSETNLNLGIGYPF